jgi:hypothetical protein
MAHAALDEFVRVLRLDNPTSDALVAAQRALDAAAQEIDSFLGEALADTVVLTDEQTALLEQVNLDRATEHWRSTPFGALNQGPDIVPILVARNSFYRHAQNLASLKVSWGVG